MSDGYELSRRKCVLIYTVQNITKRVKHILILKRYYYLTYIYYRISHTVSLI